MSLLQTFHIAYMVLQRPCLKKKKKNLFWFVFPFCTVHFLCLADGSNIITKVVIPHKI
jgi:hypothetical protein